MLKGAKEQPDAIAISAKTMNSDRETINRWVVMDNNSLKE